MHENALLALSQTLTWILGKRIGRKMRRRKKREKKWRCKRRRTGRRRKSEENRYSRIFIFRPWQLCL